MTGDTKPKVISQEDAKALQLERESQAAFAAAITIRYRFLSSTRGSENPRGLIQEEVRGILHSIQDL